MAQAMNRLKTRIATFDKWPRSSPTALALSEAGFYYSGDPADAEDDTVTCFCCDKELSGWEDGDDPLNEHLAHPKTKAGCPWALLMNEKRKPTIPPTHATLQKAREASFKGWPHEKERGWVGKAKKMAKAGFHFAPSLESEDAVECIYCNLGLDGWEPKDDPLVEHERRAKELHCAFFDGIPVTGGASSIFAMTRDVFAAEMPTKEPTPAPSEVDTTETRPQRQRGRQSSLASANLAVVPRELEKKKSIKRKLPGARAKKMIDLDDSMEIGEVAQEPIPIVLKSARKKRPSADMLEKLDESPSQQAPLKRPRLRRARSNSISSVTNYAEDLLSPEAEKPQRRQSRARGQKGRTPLEDVSESIHNTEPSEVPAVHSIKEEEEEEEINVPKSRSARGRRPSTQPVSDKENPVKPAKTKATHMSNTRTRRSTRASSIEPSSGVIPPLEDNIDSTRISSDHSKNLLPVAIQEECEEESAMTDSFASAHSRPSSVDSASTSQISIGNVVSELDTWQSNVDATSTNSQQSNKSFIRVPSKGSARPIPSRRGSAASRSNLEDVLHVSSGLNVRAAASDPVLHGNDDATKISVSTSKTQSTSSQRRTSSRRRPSNSLQSDNIEEIVMLDHRAKPKPQRMARKVAIPSSTHNTNLSQDIVIEEEADDEHASQQTSTVSAATSEKRSSGKTVEVVVPKEQSVVPQLDEVIHPIAEQQIVLAVQPTRDVIDDSDNLALAISAAGQDSLNDLEERPSQLEDMTFDEDDRPTWYAGFRELCDKGQQSMGKEIDDLSSLTSDQLSMTVETWLMYMARQEAIALTSQCDEMIAKMVEAGRLARLDILGI